METNVFGNLFANEEQRAISGANQLQKTAQLTSHSTRLANNVMQVLQSQLSQFEGLFVASQQRHDAMDDLITQIVDLSEEDLSYLSEESMDDLEKMLRSQQSKRSRAKSKAMSRENYFTMLVGAVAENLLRLAMGKAKSSGGGAVTTEVGYTDEELAELQADAEKLKKAIRNVQSKKSIMSHKADFDKEDTRWLQLLAVEAQLKDLRSRGTAAVDEEAKRAIEVKKQAEDLLAEIPDDVSAEDAKALLEKMKQVLAGR